MFIESWWRRVGDGSTCGKRPRHVGNRNGRLSKDEGKLEWNDVDSDLESVVNSKFNRYE